MRKYIYQFVTLLIILSFVFQGCSNDENPVTTQTYERGEIVQTKSLGVKTVNEIKQLFANSISQIPFTFNYSVEIISVKYYTLDKNGDKVLVSGAFMVPQSVDNLPLLSLQHGTETRRDLVASVSPLNSVEGIIGLMSASMGYLTVLPDYIGFGVSHDIHPYLHAESLVPSIIDLMHAGKTYCSENQIKLDGRVFLTGYSEGGYLSLITQKTIEENYNSEFSLTAVAPMSGPYDLEGMMKTILQESTFDTPAYIAYFFTAYNEVYGWSRINDFFNPPYASMMLGLFDGTKTWGEILTQLPSSFTDLIKAEFVSAYLEGNETDVVAAVQANTILNWTPQAPIHFFHGDADKIVPYQNVLTAMSKFESNGAVNIQLTTIPGGTHASSGQAASIGAMQWFESFK